MGCREAEFFLLSDKDAISDSRDTQGKKMVLMSPKIMNLPSTMLDLPSKMVNLLSNMVLSLKNVGILLGV